MEENGFYIDKTQFIKVLEEEDNKSFLLFRPRRFGKTLFLSTLNYFYNVSYKEDYEKLFSKFNIYKSNLQHNSFLVLKLDFSSLNVSQGVDTFAASLTKNINREIKRFKKHYSKFEGINEISIDSDDAVSSFNELWNFCLEKDLPLLVLIDEYDSQLNYLLSKTQSQLSEHMLAQDESMKSLFRCFFSEIKIAEEISPKLECLSLVLLLLH